MMNLKPSLRRALTCAVAMCSIATASYAARAAELPTTHEYQKELRAYIGTLKTQDFAHGVTEEITVTVPDDDDEAFRTYLMSLSPQPVIGTKRGYPSVSCPPHLFTLAHIESNEEGVLRPPVFPTAVSWLVNWKYDGNPYYQNKAMKRRAVVTAIIEMVMMDQQHETQPELGYNRPERLAGRVLMMGMTYRMCHDVMPKGAQDAYKDGLRKMGNRLMDWGIKGEEINADVAGATAVWQAADALQEAEFTARAASYARTLLKDPKYFHPAGYFIQYGGLDVGFGGMAAFLCNWVTLASDWDFAQEASDKRYRLRAHLTLPEPDGTWTGPSHFNARLDSDAWHDQWDWYWREYAAAMATDEALYIVTPPTREQIEEGHKTLVGHLNFSIKQTPRKRDENNKLYHLKPEEIGSNVWKIRQWPSWNWPIATVFAYDHYVPGTYAKLKKAHESNSPLSKSPYLRGESFERHFADAFSAVRKANYAAIIHTGPVGRDNPTSGLFHFSGPLGFGGGQLSSFWTPDGGAIIQGRRGGMNWDATFDTADNWQTWPIHAVTGVTYAPPTEDDPQPVGKTFTSARIAAPIVEHTSSPQGTVITVTGELPKELLGQGKVLEGRIPYTRAFTIMDDGVKVQTQIRAFAQDKVTQLYETLPVFDPAKQHKTAFVPTKIELQQSDGTWMEATPDVTHDVVAARLTRHEGAALVSFASPQSVKLSPEVFQSRYTSRATARNLMIDLLNSDGPTVLSGTYGATYTITPIAKPAAE